MGEYLTAAKSNRIFDEEFVTALGSLFSGGQSKAVEKSGQ